MSNAPLTEPAAPEPADTAPRPRNWYGNFKSGFRDLLRDLNAYAGLLNVILGVIGALYLVNEWQARQDEARIKAIEALTGSASQSRAALVYLSRVGANLEHQNLSGANLSGLALEDADMADARLDNADLVSSTLTGDLSAVSLRCADISNITLDSGDHTRPVDARGARIGMNDAKLVSWNSPVIHSSVAVLDKLGDSLGRDMVGEKAAATALGVVRGAIADDSLPYCLYERLKGQGASHERLCRGGVQWDGVAC